MEEKKEKEKKVSTFKTLIIKRIIFIIIFTIIAGSITTYLIIKNPFTQENTKSSSKEENLENEVTKTPARNHISLLNYDTDTFNYNNLRINEINEHYEGYDISYFQIDGLKNSDIQEKINRSLNYDLKTKITEAKNNGNIKGDFDVYSSSPSNFGNTISIMYILNSYIYDENISDYTYEWYGYVSENYDLRTGKKIQIQDLFTDDCLGSDIFNNNFYNSLVRNFTKQNFNDEYETLYVADYNNIEEKLLELIINFNEGKDIPFYFDEQSVTLAEYSSKIFFEDVLDFVAVYNNFKSNENIFNGKYEGLQNIPVLTKRFPYSYHQVIEEGENYYIDFTLSYLYSNSIEDEKIKKTLLEKSSDILNEDTQRIKKEIKDNENFTIFNYCYELSKDYDYENLYVLSITKAKKQLSKILYDNEYKEKIQNIFRKAMRYETGEMYLNGNLFYSYTLSENEISIQDGGWNCDTTELYLDKQGNTYLSKDEALGNIIPWGIND